MIKGFFKKACILILCICLVFPFSSCSTAPKYEDIEERFKELVEKAYEINKVLFGTGLPTYERVYDPRESVEVYRDGEMTYWYFFIDDEELGKVVGYRSSFLDDFEYACVTDTELPQKTPVFSDGEHFAYALDGYTEPHHEFVYRAKDPANYDYVRVESDYQSVAQIKAEAAKIYSKDFLEQSIFEALFVGAVVSEDAMNEGLKARYIEYSRDGSVFLMQSNEYEPLVEKTLIFDFSTAKIVRPSNKKYVNIQVDAYYEGEEQTRLSVRVTLVNQDGEWFLDTPTI